MFTAEYEGINSFLVGASNLLLREGVHRKTRGSNCWELPAPFMFKIRNPTARLVTIPQRNWNPVLPFAESLWLAMGRNDLAFISHYLKKMNDYSDDGFFLRGGYGPRLRKYNGIRNDYRISNTIHAKIDNSGASQVDQFKYICKNFESDINTRRAIINIGDPPKDCFEINGSLKTTLDFPCTRLLHFQKDSNEAKLNLTVYMRSNDFMWGASAVNIFNFTFIQEYFAKILNLEIGEYYHIANNFHYYERHKEQIKNISKVVDVEDNGFNYSKSFINLTEFDIQIQKLQNEEEKLRTDGANEIVNFDDDFFNDWFKTFYCYNTKHKVEFSNPILNELFKKYQTL
ncbi:MAG: thymidylate synthase [Bacteroidetes bacterium HGW-Bacteroidetes-17]|nr:MAG: thymidylate synthase [Bacteroidetes bacterium HGW-Bacteroidetes-17]